MVEALYLFLQRIGYHHPLHPPLTHLPMGLIMACFIFALLAMLLSQPALLRSAYQPVEKLTSQGIIGKLNSRLIFLRRLS